MCDQPNDTPIMSGANAARGEREGRLRLAGWAAVAFVLVALAVPWFLWRDATVVAGLPLWVWWHVGWMALASVVFYVFTKRAWGIGIVRADAGHGETTEADDPVDAEEVSQRG